MAAPRDFQSLLFALQTIPWHWFYYGYSGLAFAAGLAWHPDGKRLLLSYGVGDKEAWIAAVDASRGGSTCTTRTPSAVAMSPVPSVL